MLVLKTLEHIFLNQEQKLNLLLFLRWTNQYHFALEKHGQSKPIEQLLNLNNLI